MPSGNNAESLLNKLLTEFKGLSPFSKKPTNKSESVILQTPSTKTPTGYQAPIKGTFYNSGDFIPDKYLNPMHPHGHKGVDLRAPGGTAIYPIAPGVVLSIGSSPKGGNNAVIQHPNNVKTYYAHMGSIKVHKGDKVDVNTVIGTVGESGNAKGGIPHLHFQVWENGTLKNPKTFFSMPSYSNVNKQEKRWLSTDHKQNANKFNIHQHLSSNPDQLLKIAEYFYQLALK
jgi:murein DD-endopeptidase MepM/ murein hydrolase activator NlpD